MSHFQGHYEHAHQDGFRTFACRGLCAWLLMTWDHQPDGCFCNSVRISNDLESGIASEFPLLRCSISLKQGVHKVFTALIQKRLKSFLLDYYQQMGPGCAKTWWTNQVVGTSWSIMETGWAWALFFFFLSVMASVYVVMRTAWSAISSLGQIHPISISSLKTHENEHNDSGNKIIHPSLSPLLGWYGSSSSRSEAHISSSSGGEKQFQTEMGNVIPSACPGSRMLPTSSACFSWQGGPVWFYILSFPGREHDGKISIYKEKNVSVWHHLHISFYKNDIFLDTIWSPDLLGWTHMVPRGVPVFFY